MNYFCKPTTTPAPHINLLLDPTLRGGGGGILLNTTQRQCEDLDV